MFVFNKNIWRKLSLYVSLDIENFVGGENVRSEEAASILVLQLCLQLLSNEKKWCLSSLETMQVNFLTFLADAPLQPST